MELGNPVVTEKTFAVVVVVDDQAMVYQSNDLRLLASKAKEAKRKKQPYVILGAK